MSLRSRDRSGSSRKERKTKKNHSGPTGCFWRPLKLAAAAAHLESPRAWPSQTRGYRSARAGGGSGLFPRRVGPFSRGALARLQTPEGAKLTSHGLRARTPRARSVHPSRARAVLRDDPEAARPRGEARAPRAAAGRSASPRLTQLRCAAESRTAHSEGARRRVACAAPLSAGRAPGPRTELPGPPRRAAAPGAERLPPDRRRPLAPAPAWPRGASGSGGRRRRRRRRRDCLLPAPRVSSPRHREGQGDWARGPRPVTARAPGPPFARALSSRARGRCRLTWCWPQPWARTRIPAAPSNRTEMPAAYWGLRRPLRPPRPLRPQVREECSRRRRRRRPQPAYRRSSKSKRRESGGETPGVLGGHAPGAPVWGFISLVAAELRAAALRLKFFCPLSAESVSFWLFVRSGTGKPSYLRKIILFFHNYPLSLQGRYWVFWIKIAQCNVRRAVCECVCSGEGV